MSEKQHLNNAVGAKEKDAEKGRHACVKHFRSKQAKQPAKNHLGEAKNKFDVHNLFASRAPQHKAAQHIA
jgi:hypothetical protein